MVGGVLGDVAAFVRVGGQVVALIFVEAIEDVLVLVAPDRALRVEETLAVALANASSSQAASAAPGWSSGASERP